MSEENKKIDIKKLIGKVEERGDYQNIERKAMPVNPVPQSLLDNIQTKPKTNNKNETN